MSIIVSGLRSYDSRIYIIQEVLKTSLKIYRLIGMHMQVVKSRLIPPTCLDNLNHGTLASGESFNPQLFSWACKSATSSHVRGNSTKRKGPSHSTVLHARGCNTRYRSHIRTNNQVVWSLLLKHDWSMGKDIRVE